MNKTSSFESLYGNESGRRILWWLSLGFIIFIGLFVRLETWFDWQAKPYRVFYQDEPVLMNLDGYYYLSLARDLLDNQYTEVNTFRTVPDHPSRFSTPPLLSVIVVIVHHLTSLSLDWIAAFLPVVLSLTLILPVYLFGRDIGGRSMGLSSALLSLVSPYFVYRSSLGWFDTDCLLVSLILMAGYVFYKFSEIKRRSRYWYFISGIIIYWVALWWWDQVFHVVTVLILFPMVLALVFYYRPARREWVIYAPIILVAIAVTLFWRGMGFPLFFFREVLGTMAYVAGLDATEMFPGVKSSVAEQAMLIFEMAVRQTAGHWLILTVAMYGFLMLLVRHLRIGLFLLVPLGLSLLGYFVANRFLIFMAPVFGLGAGYMVSCIWKLRKNSWLYKWLALFLTLCTMFPAYLEVIHTERLPGIHPRIIEGMDRVSNLTPEDAAVWTSWGHGYPMIYWGRRATLADGGLHGSERIIHLALPLVSSNPRFSANFMRFFVSYGLAGMHRFSSAFDLDPHAAHIAMNKILSKGPGNAAEVLLRLKANMSEKDVREWVDYFYPQDARKIYLYIDLNLVRTSKWWYWFGSWDFSKQSGNLAYYNAFMDIEEKGRIYTDASGLALNTDTGTAKINGELMPLNYFLDVEKGGGRIKYEGNAVFAAEYARSRNTIVVGDTAILDSLFNKLYLRQSELSPYFQLIDENNPAYQLWGVQADKVSPMK